MRAQWAPPTPRARGRVLRGQCGPVRGRGHKGATASWAAAYLAGPARPVCRPRGGLRGLRPRTKQACSHFFHTPKTPPASRRLVFIRDVSRQYANMIFTRKGKNNFFKRNYVIETGKGVERGAERGFIGRLLAGRKKLRESKHAAGRQVQRQVIFVFSPIFFPFCSGCYDSLRARAAGERSGGGGAACSRTAIAAP